MAGQESPRQKSDDVEQAGGEDVEEDDEEDEEDEQRLRSEGMKGESERSIERSRLRLFRAVR